MDVDNTVVDFQKYQRLSRIIDFDMIDERKDVHPLHSLSVNKSYNRQQKIQKELLESGLIDLPYFK